MGIAADPPAWYKQFTAAESDEASELYCVLADEGRRTLLSVLRPRDTPVSESRLAQLMAARENGDSSNTVATVDRERVELSLHHIQLPHLEAAGLIERTEDDYINCTQHPFWTSSDVHTLITQDDIEPCPLTKTFDVLADYRRRAMLTLLKDKQELTVGEVAEELAETPLSGQELSNLTAELVHRHIPKLADSGVVEVDSTGNNIRYIGNVVLEEWFSDVRTHREA
ncbi:winged helix-turn-helix domain-containing protein [Haladaptatus sp. NG-WS-4]